MHSYGFKHNCRVTDVTCLVRQLLFIAAAWNIPVFMAFQDVEFAFDSMEHEHVATALLARGASPLLVAAHMRELAGLRATMSIAGAGETLPFAYSKGGKQGGVETPDES